MVRGHSDLWEGAGKGAPTANSPRLGTRKDPVREVVRAWRGKVSMGVPNRNLFAVGVPRPGAVTGKG